MRCQAHHPGLSYKQFHEKTSCTECSNPTECQDDVLCIDCSNGFDECSLCRASRKNTTDKRLLAAFRSPEAALIRAARSRTRQNFVAKRSAVYADLATDSARAVAELEKLLKPHRLACAKACQPYREQLDALNEDHTAESQSMQLSALRLSTLTESQRLAHEKCDKQCEPHLEKFERATLALVDAHKKKMAPFKSTAARRRTRLHDEMENDLRRLESEMCTLLNRSTNVFYVIFKTSKQFWKRLTEG